MKFSGEGLGPELEIFRFKAIFNYGISLDDFEVILLSAHPTSQASWYGVKL